MSKTSKKIFMLVDAHALIHKGYHAIPNLSTSKGVPTNGIYGFASIFLTAIKDLKPEFIAVAFDLPKPTFRHKQYLEYKAHRKPAPRELTLQIPRVHDLVEALNIPIYKKEGYEADDLIGSLVKKIERENPNLEIVIVTGDRDLLQLVSSKTCVYYAGGRGMSKASKMRPKEVQEKYQLNPDELLDYKALIGDPSDNIPGVPGVGTKTATELLHEYGSLDKIYEGIAKEQTEIIKPKVLENLKKHKKDAYLSKELSKIITDIDIDVNFDNCRLKNYDTTKVVKIFQELEFKSLIEKLPPTDENLTVEDIKQKKLKTFHQDKDYNYLLVEKGKDLSQLIKELNQQSEITLDTETDNLNPLKAKVVGISFSWNEGDAFYVDITERPEFLEKLKPVLENADIKKIGHNLKYDYQVLLNHNIKLAGIYFDTMIASYLLNPGSRQHGLSTAVFNELGYEMISFEDLAGKGKKQKKITEIEKSELSDYACEDSDYTMRLYKIFKQRLYEEKLLHVLEDLEMSLVPILAAMEREGIALDTDFLLNLSNKFHKSLDSLEKEIYKLAGDEFNINSPAQLSKVFFENLKIDSTDIKKTKTGISTAASELEKMIDRHPIISKIMEYRELAKLVSTYVDALPAMVDENNRIHTSFNQTVTATGRLSSSDPNIQNIPIRTDDGREIRKAFIAASGFQLLAIDYSQVELRIAASLSGDQGMIEIFKAGHDFHTATASKIFDIPLDKVSPTQRRDAKTINFSVLYGVSAFGLSSRSEMNRKEAQEFIEKYYQTFPRLKKFIDETIENTREKGWVSNLLGRKRYFPEIIASNYQVRSAAERAAFNMPLQSLAADIMKMAMIKINQEISSEKVKMLLQVHDELVFEIKAGEEKLFAKQIREIMENVYELKVPLIADAKIGNNWKEMEELK